MSKSALPTKPLRILTLDGGGNYVIATLFILRDLLFEIEKSSDDPDEILRACDVFDIIAGTGIGGWLALLLGRFHLDIPSALAEWYHLNECIQSMSRSEEKRIRRKQHSYYATDRLDAEIDRLAIFYETDRQLIPTSLEGYRCKKVFVSALNNNSKKGDPEYMLCRAYEIPKDAEVLEGASNPLDYKIAHAFAATGVEKLLTPPWKEPPKAQKSNAGIPDSNFPHSHNITELALDEVWGLYGTDVEISIVVNLGPGVPIATDTQIVAKRSFWGKKTVAASSKSTTERPPLQPQEQDANTIKSHLHPKEPSSSITGGSPSATASLGEDKNTSAIGASPPSTLNPKGGADTNTMLNKDGRKIVEHINTRLRSVYGDSHPPYYRFAPDSCAPHEAGTSSHDASSDAAKYYLGRPNVKTLIAEASQFLTVESGSQV